MGAPPAEAGEGEPDTPLPTDQTGEPRRFQRKAVCRRRAIVGPPLLGREIADQFGSHHLPVPIGLAQPVVSSIEADQSSAKFPPGQWRLASPPPAARESWHRDTG